MRFFSVALAASITLAACSSSDDEISAEMRCLVGSYRVPAGDVIDVGLSSSDHLRWRVMSGEVGRVSRDEDGVWTGTTGWSDLPHTARLAMTACGSDGMEISGIEGLQGPATRISHDIQDVRFTGADEELAGRLVMPAGSEPVPIVVLVHGSEDWSARDYAFLQRMLPAHGIGAFVYDKRGTGASTGQYTQDFDLLAADAAAAHRTALELAGARASSSGYLGGSQGGWVAPLAATLSQPDFVIASFGLAESPLAEDREQVQMELREAGYDDAVLDRARQVTDITGRLLASNFQDGAEDLARVRREWGDEAWFQDMRGEITGEMTMRPLWQFRMGYRFLGVGTSWGYEPVPVLREVGVPMLWVLAGADREAPSAPTRQILTELQSDGHIIDIAFFPDTDHGITRFVEAEDGSRQGLGYAQGYLEMLVDWSRHQAFTQTYGNAELSPFAAPPLNDFANED